MKLKQVDLFLNDLPLCHFCGYPLLPLKAMRCEYGYASSLDNFEPFKVYWHVDLDEEKRWNEKIMDQVFGAIDKFLEERPIIREKLKVDRVESWVDEHDLNGRNPEEEFRKMCARQERFERNGNRHVPPSQVSIVGYMFGGSSKEAEK